LSFFLLVFVLSNGAGSVFNILYNSWLIGRHYLDDEQQVVFWQVMVPFYNVIAYPAGLGLMLWLLWPLLVSYRRLRAGERLPPDQMENCRRLVINLPFYEVCINFLAWFPGGVVFPLGICLLGGWHNGGAIWLQFLVSFTVSAVLTTVQTFFLVEAFVIAVFYPELFQDVRPAEIQGVLRISYGKRLLVLWLAVAVGPLLALLVVALNLIDLPEGSAADLPQLALGVAIVGAASGGIVAWLVGRNLLSWMMAHAAATEQIAHGNYDVRIREQRPDEWGRLTDHFNDMAGALGRARHLSETFGQFVSPEVRDEILDRPILGGEVVEVTVLFVDIRGFTQRTAGQPPESTVALLNRFLSLVVASVEENGGWVNKFLGDGVMALFGSPRPRSGHADLALQAATVLLERLRLLNQQLEEEAQAALIIGAGIHTGLALVGSIGAALHGRDGVARMRREFTAIGETVNLCQRLEQFTKHVAGPVLVSEATRQRLLQPFPLTCLGRQNLPGYAESMILHRLET
jgi:adenylate cyclase